MIRFRLLGLFLLGFAHAAVGQQPDALVEARRELELLKERVSQLESVIERLEASTPQPVSTPEAAAATYQPAPAINTPPALPPSRPDAYEKTTPRFDVVIQTRADFFRDPNRTDTFILRKAELGVKGHVTDGVDYVIELDPVRPADPFRRTYVRLSPLDYLHFKIGLEKAPIGLEELTSNAQIPFVERSEVSDRYAAAEELGLHLESRWESWLLQFSVSNGGRRLLRDDNNRKDLTARVVWGPRPWLSFGTAALSGRSGAESAEKDRYNLELKIGSNLTGLQGEFYRARDADVWSSAYYVAGYYALPMRRWLTHVQPAVRYEWNGHSANARDRNLSVLTFGFNLLLDEHRSKLQINYLKDFLDRGDRDAVRAQYQIEF